MAEPLFYAGVLVRVRPDVWAEGLAALAAVDGVELHHQDIETGRVVATVETRAMEQQESVIRTIRGLPGVLLAEPVYAYATEGESA